MGFDLRESKICIIRIHASNFFSSWSAKNLEIGKKKRTSYNNHTSMTIRNMFTEPGNRLHLDYLNQLINCTFPRKQWLQRDNKS